MNIPMIKLPTYELTLPSTQETIQYRPYTVREEKILVMAMQSNDDQQIKTAMSDIVKNCTFDKVDIDTFPMFDVQYVFLKLRCKSVGEVSEVTVSCAGCGSTQPHFINLDAIQVTQSEEQNNVIDYGDFKLVMRYPVIADVALLNQTEDLDAAFNVIVSCVKHVLTDEEQIDNDENSFETISELIENMVPEQFSKLQKFFGNMPAVTHEIKFNCQKCELENTIEINGIYNFFL